MSEGKRGKAKGRNVFTSHSHIIGNGKSGGGNGNSNSHVESKPTPATSSSAKPSIVDQQGPEDDESSKLTKQKWEKMIQKGLIEFIEQHRYAEFHKIYSDTFLRRVKRGIPQAFRWKVWRAAVAEGATEGANRTNTYENLVKKENKWIPLIKIDISRTFPEADEFNEELQAKY